MAGGLDTAKLAAARLWAATRYPYLASALFASALVAAPDSNTVAVDGGWRLLVDPAVLAEWTVEQIGSVLVHHACHLLRDHADRARGRGVNASSADRWLTAADAEINDDFPDGSLAFPFTPVVPGALGCADGLLAEEYFSALLDRPPCSVPLQCGSGATGMGTGDEFGDEGAGLTDFAAELVRRGVARDIVEAAKQPGIVPDGLRRWADSLLTPKVDWRQVLAAEVRRGLQTAAGMVDYTYRRPSRRAGAVEGVVLPSLVAPQPDVAVVCDTSGSMNGALLSQAVAELDGILRAVGVGPSGVRLLSCDAAVGSVRRIASARAVELVGGGGTDMGVGIAAAAACRPKPSVIIVLTDGYTPWPAARPANTSVVVALLSSAPPPPPWARWVRVDPAVAADVRP